VRLRWRHSVFGLVLGSVGPTIVYVGMVFPHATGLFFPVDVTLYSPLIVLLMGLEFMPNHLQWIIGFGVMLGNMILYGSMGLLSGLIDEQWSVLRKVRWQHTSILLSHIVSSCVFCAVVLMINIFVYRLFLGVQLSDQVSHFGGMIMWPITVYYTSAIFIALWRVFRKLGSSVQ
jgi:hypothetical protein